MKKIIILLIAIVTLSSCNKDTTSAITTTPDSTNQKIIIKDNLTIEDLVAFLPLEYFDESTKLVYTDASINEKVFTLTAIQDHKRPFETNTIKFTYDAFQVDFTPLDNSNYILRVRGSASYNEQENLQSNVLTFNLVKKGETFGDHTILEFRDGKFFDQGFTTTFSPYSIRDKTYPFAYQSQWGFSDFPSADIVVSPNVGFITFTDYDGVQWVFDRFEH